MGELPASSRIHYSSFDDENIHVDESFVVQTHIGTLSVIYGSLSDGASAPLFTLNILGLSRYDPQIIRAVVTHDVLYGFEGVSKRDADIIFYNILVADGLDRIRAGVLYSAVVVGGHSSYLANIDSPPNVVLVMS